MVDKIHKINNTTFTINEKYKDLKVIGQGSYGVVCSALDATQKKNVAIKKITPMAKHTVDAKHVLREIRLMKHMGKHENIVSLDDLFVREDADELYIVMELMDSDLHRVIQSPQKLTESHHRHFMHQLLCGVKYLHDNKIIHRDLKPGNLLVTRDCRLRITDFGLARQKASSRGINGSEDAIDEPMTEHVVTRWYRSPELMLLPDGLYTYAVDTWSCGCILGELLRRRPLFPGKNFIEQLTLIFDVIGAPKPEDIQHIRNVQAVKFLEAQMHKRKKPMENVIPNAPSGSLSLIESLLIIAPEERMTVDEALTSSFFKPISTSTLIAPSLIFPEVSPDFEFEFESAEMSKFQLKQLILQEVAKCKKSNVTGATSSRRTQSAPRSRRSSADSSGEDISSSAAAAAATQVLSGSGKQSLAGTSNIEKDISQKKPVRPDSAIGTSKPTQDRSASGFGMRPTSGVRRNGSLPAKKSDLHTCPMTGVSNGIIAGVGAGAGSKEILGGSLRTGIGRGQSAGAVNVLSKHGVTGVAVSEASAIPPSPSRKNKSSLELLEQSSSKAMAFLSPNRKEKVTVRKKVTESLSPAGNVMNHNRAGTQLEDDTNSATGRDSTSLSSRYVEDQEVTDLRRRLAELDKDAMIEEMNDETESALEEEGGVMSTSRMQPYAKQHPNNEVSRGASASATITGAYGHASDISQQDRASKLTVPKSPKFGKMSWERRRNTTSVSGAVGSRATSAARTHRASDRDEKHVVGTGLVKGVSAGAVSGGGQRAMSAGRGGRQPIKPTSSEAHVPSGALTDRGGLRRDSVASTVVTSASHGAVPRSTRSGGMKGKEPIRGSSASRTGHAKGGGVRDDPTKRRWEILELERQLKTEQERLKQLAQPKRASLSRR